MEQSKVIHFSPTRPEHTQVTDVIKSEILLYDAHMELDVHYIFDAGDREDEQLGIKVPDTGIRQFKIFIPKNMVIVEATTQYHIDDSDLTGGIDGLIIRGGTFEGHLDMPTEERDNIYYLLKVWLCK